MKKALAIMAAMIMGVAVGMADYTPSTEEAGGVRIDPELLGRFKIVSSTNLIFETVGNGTTNYNTYITNSIDADILN